MARRAVRRAVVRSRRWLQEAVHPLRLSLRRAVCEDRALPEFVIIGAQRSGTTSLYWYLAQHPEVVPAVQKEIHFFDTNYDRGVSWYRAHFPPSRRLGPAGRITGEATPYYLYHPEVPRRAAKTLPAARFIALLRHPVDRAFSHYRLQVEMGHEPLSFREALAAEQDRLEASASFDEYGAAVQRYSYFSRGLYDEQLERWFDQVGEHRLLVLETSLLQREPGRAMEQVADHLGISADFTFRRRHRNVAVDDRELDPRLRAELTARYRPSMGRLRELVGVDLSSDVSP